MTKKSPEPRDPAQLTKAVADEATAERAKPHGIALWPDGEPRDRIVLRNDPKMLMTIVRGPEEPRPSKAVRTD
jgi:hypothetical protein